MGFKKEDLKKAEHPLYDFGNKRIEALGKIDVSRVTGFPEFPNTSPSGKRVDSDDPITRKLEFQ
jgi:hypothetical protein